MKTVKNLCQVFCILAMLTTFTNCHNDVVSENETLETVDNTFPFKSSLLTKQDVESNRKLSDQMRSLKSLQSSGYENIYNSVYDFTVDTDVVKLIESTENNSHSYTFPIERDNGGSELENLVFVYDETIDDYTASIVTYHFSASQKQQFIETQHVSTAYNISYEPISIILSDVLGENTMPIPCTTIYTTYHITPDTGETFVYSDGHVQNQCQHEDEEGISQCETYTVIEIDCPQGGSDGGTSSNNTNNNPYSTPNNTASGGNSNTSSGSTTPNTNDDNHYDIVTSPITKDEYQQITSIYNQVVGGGNWVIKENEEPSEDDPIIESTEELNALLESLISNNFEFESTEDIDSNGLTQWDHHRMEFSSFPNASIKASVRRKVFTPGTLDMLQVSDILGIRTRIVGNTTTYNWTQLDDETISNTFSSPSVVLDTQYNSLKISLNGEMEIDTSSFGRKITIVKGITVIVNYNIITGLLLPEHSYWVYQELD
jgi:hypothetical protein